VGAYGVKRKTLWKISAWVSALLVAAASEFYPVVGLLGAALIFPDGIHSDYPTGYLILAMVLNFTIFFIATYGLFQLIIRRSGTATNSD